jgi:hypothetical protein
VQLKTKFVPVCNAQTLAAISYLPSRSVSHPDRILYRSFYAAPRGVTCGLIIAPAPLCSCLPSVKPVKSLASVFK